MLNLYVKESPIFLHEGDVMLNFFTILANLERISKNY